MTSPGASMADIPPGPLTAAEKQERVIQLLKHGHRIKTIHTIIGRLGATQSQVDQWICQARAQLKGQPKAPMVDVVAERFGKSAPRQSPEATAPSLNGPEDHKPGVML